MFGSAISPAAVRIRHPSLDDGRLMAAVINTVSRVILVTGSTANNTSEKKKKKKLRLVKVIMMDSSDRPLLASCVLIS